MSRKQVVSLTSAILMVALITNIAGWIQNAEAHPSLTLKQNITHACVDTDHNYQSDICQSISYTQWSYRYPWTGHTWDSPRHHGVLSSEKDVYKSTGVTSCSQCPNPPFYHYGG